MITLAVFMAFLALIFSLFALWVSTVNARETALVLRNMKDASDLIALAQIEAENRNKDLARDSGLSG